MTFSAREGAIMQGNGEVDFRRKKIAYHVARRANLELETLLSNFWRRYGLNLDDDQVRIFEELLEMDDLDLLESILGKRHVETEEQRELIKLIRDNWRLTTA